MSSDLEMIRELRREMNDKLIRLEQSMIHKIIVESKETVRQELERMEREKHWR
tara:strand:- start:3 stop:161 length:159 start_codon:yes stop_codon:yes gene_type:complete